MKIIKIYSEVDTEERLFSVLLDEDEALLFSEFQKEFARKDYEGLGEKAASGLKEKRSELAKRLKKMREEANTKFKDSVDLRNESYDDALNISGIGKKAARRKAERMDEADKIFDGLKEGVEKRKQQSSQEYQKLMEETENLRKKSKQDYDRMKDLEKKLKDEKSKVSQFLHKQKADKLRAKKTRAKNLKIGAGTLTVAGAAYGAKKYRDSKKKK